MTYIILAAGEGKSLYPLTAKYPKASFKLDDDRTILQSIVDDIREFDGDSEIIVVVGYLSKTIEKELEDRNVIFVNNPFYDITNSISSLWFARQYLNRDNVSILHGDVVFSKEIMKKVITKPTDYPFILVDKKHGNKDSYNVCIDGNTISIMSKQLEHYDAEYSCVTKLDAVSSRLLKEEIEDMIERSMHDLYYEDSLVQMILFHGFTLNYKCVDTNQWKHINTAEDFISAKKIRQN